MAVEYKLPYELTGNDLVTGLVSEIQLERDVINRGDDNLVFPAKALAAAAITQLFPHLVRMGVQYGYICTGQAFVFLYIPDDPTSVRYHVCVPNLDIIEDNENRLHRTAFVQVLAFTLRALRVPLPPQSWNDTASRLGRWVVEFKDMLVRFSNAAARRPPSASPYKALRRKSLERSPISRPDNDSGNTHLSMTRSVSRTAILDTIPDQGRHQSRQEGRKEGMVTRERIHDQPYCTRQCIFGLTLGRAIDKTCPNAHSHGPRHISQSEFLRLLRVQSAC